MRHTIIIQRHSNQIKKRILLKRSIDNTSMLFLSQLTMNLITIIGIGASAFTAASTFPQLIKIFKEKKADDISIPMLILLFIGLSLWVWYGIEKTDWIIIISNSFSLVINILLVILSVKYKNK